MLDLEGLEDSRDPSEFLGEGERLGVEFVFKNPCMNFLSNGFFRYNPILFCRLMFGFLNNL